jgi:hypothetical protein
MDGKYQIGDGGRGLLASRGRGPCWSLILVNQRPGGKKIPKGEQTDFPQSGPAHLPAL